MSRDTKIGWIMVGLIAAFVLWRWYSSRTHQRAHAEFEACVLERVGDQALKPERPLDHIVESAFDNCRQDNPYPDSSHTDDLAPF